MPAGPGPLSPRPPWRDARIVLGVTGGIAAYKSIQLARDLTRSGARVDVIMSRGARHFVQPLSFEGVTGRTVFTELFDSDGAAQHIRLGHEADLVLVAPATADFLARAAHGRADDLLTTTLLATRAPVVVCPAMNDLMYAHPQVQRNVDHVRDVLGYRVLGPAVGPLAYGEGEGPGRLVEPPEIVEWAGRVLGRDSDFRGRTVLVTAGPTREAVDAVRYVGNRSSGRMGFALAREAWLRGADVALVTGPVGLDDPPGVTTVRVESAREMEAAVRERLPHAHAVVFAAAVADYRPADARTDKMKRSKQGDTLTLELVANPDVATDTRGDRRDDAVVVGFALETDDLIENARAKLESKGFDLIVANATGEDSGFESETNRVTLLSREGGGESGSDGEAEAEGEPEPEELPLMKKDEVAREVMDRVGARLRRRLSGEERR